MVNYVLSFCKITGASKIFKKHFYLPLLKPINPKEALRTLRITGKWLLGGKIQRYIPVLLNHSQKRSKNVNNFGKMPHFKSSDYTYMTPILDLENENHKLLHEILDKKEKNGCYCYTVDYKKYNIVFESDFEHAIRDGDIIDIMVSQKNDKILVKLKDRKKIPVEIQYFEGNFDQLMCGEGATTEEEEKQHHYGKYTMSLAQLFEEKELREEKWEEELKKIMKRRKKQKWENSKAYKEMMKRTMKNLDWNKFEDEAKKVIEEISDPLTEIPIEMEVDDLESTKNVNETLLSHGPGILNQLPTITEIPDLIKNMGSAEISEIEDASSEENQTKRRVSGIKVTLPSGKECFVSGQMVLTEDGEVFIPGQTIQNEYGDEYVPGITTNVDNKPTLISGLIMGEDQKEPMFLPSQSTITADGQLTFATTPEERPPPQIESERKVKRKKKPNILQEPAEIIIMEEILEEPSDSEEKSTSISSVELNNSEIEELDMEAIRLNQERHRMEMEKLKMQLFDNMDDIIANLEDKKVQLMKKLEDLRRQHLNNENNLVSYATEKDAIEIAFKITDNPDAINRLADILLTMTRRSSTFRDKNSVRADNIDLSYLSTNAGDAEIKFHSCSNKLKIVFKTALVAANDVFKNRPKDQVLALTTIGGILVQSLKNDIKLTLELTNLMKTQVDRDAVCETALKQLTRIIEDTKICILAMIVDKPMPISDVIESIEKILGGENVMQIAFAKILKINPVIVHCLIENLEDHLKEVASEEEAVKVLQKCIVETVRYQLDSNLEQIKRKPLYYKELVEQAVSFAKALGLDDVVEDLSNPTQDYFLEDSVNMLKRMTLIKQLSERDYSLKSAIARIKKNSECAKTDPRIRQLIRESAVLLSNQSPLLTSRSIPLHLMKKQNLLAIEDYLVKRTNIEFPVLISRGALQAVIPKDASRGVLAGRVPYVLIDETGITNFKPMHMMSAIHVNKNREKRIDDYLSAVPDSDPSTYFKAKNNVRRLKSLINRKNA